MIETLLGKFTAATLPAKAGLAAAMLTLATVAAGATGVLPASAEELISDVVEDVTGIELPADDEDAEEPEATDPDATEETTDDETDGDAAEGEDADGTTDEGAEDGAEEEAAEEEDTTDDSADEDSDDAGTTPDADSSGYRNFGSWVSAWAHSPDKPEDFGQMVSEEAHRRNEARRPSADESDASADEPEAPADEEAAPAPEPEATAPAVAPSEKPKQRPAAANSGTTAGHSQPADSRPPSGRGRPAGPGGRK